MAYRRRQGVGARDSIFIQEDFGISNPNSSRTYSPPSTADETSSSGTSSLAAKAIRASSAHRDSSLSFAYGQSAISSRDSKSNPLRSSQPSSSKDTSKYSYTSVKSLDEPKRGFWGVLARKARSIIEDDDDDVQQGEIRQPQRQQMSDVGTKTQNNQYQSSENRRKAENPALQKGIGAIASSLNYIGGTIGNALEGGITIVENRTADIIQETRKLQIGKKGSLSEARNPASSVGNTMQPIQMRTHHQPQSQTDAEIQLKASRDVAMAMAAKTKLLLRELKTVKADLAFAKERGAQLEEENRILRESSGDADNQENDDLIRLQLETLLAEKARLAQENSVFARENRFLREIVEYHQLTMQDVVYLDEGNEEVTEVFPIRMPSTNNSQSLNITPTVPPLAFPTNNPLSQPQTVSRQSSFTRSEQDQERC